MMPPKPASNYVKSIGLLFLCDLALFFWMKIGFIYSVLLKGGLFLNLNANAMSKAAANLMLISQPFFWIPNIMQILMKKLNKPWKQIKGRRGKRRRTTRKCNNNTIVRLRASLIQSRDVKLNGDKDRCVIVHKVTWDLPNATDTNDRSNRHTHTLNTLFRSLMAFHLRRKCAWNKS